MTRTSFVFKSLLVSSLLFAGQTALAQIEGVYKSDSDDGCMVTISEINIPAPKFGDAYYRIESRGVAACMWDGVGISISTNLAGAYITLPPVHNRVNIHARWLFGPTSPKVEIIQRNADGEHLLTGTFTRQ
ncbi:MAG: hypothetical protein WD071_00740 [Pseudohongiella sp.]|uniref:hypothetical protein n=1 Tax=Pseudohongiella sp. TaxID=1979412 RepID=UPI0034A07318